VIELKIFLILSFITSALIYMDSKQKITALETRFNEYLAQVDKENSHLKKVISEIRVIAREILVLTKDPEVIKRVIEILLKK
jgi:hypothetical protein